jgi:hypothetical protein
MESQDSPALRKKGVKVVLIKQLKAGRILFKKTEITRFHPTNVFRDENCLKAIFRRTKTPIHPPIGAFTESVNSDCEKSFFFFFF